MIPTLGEEVRRRREEQLQQHLSPEDQLTARIAERMRELHNRLQERPGQAHLFRGALPFNPTDDIQLTPADDPESDAPPNPLALYNPRGNGNCLFK